MTPEDLDRLRKWCGYPRAHHFRPDQSPGDEMILVEKLLGEGHGIYITYNTISKTYRCRLIDKHSEAHLVMAEAPDRKEALCLAALGVCP